MFWKNKRPPYWNSISGFVFDHFTVIGMYCTSAYRISSKSDHPLWKYDVISIDQFLRWWPRRPNTTSLLPVSYLLMSLYSESQIYQQTKFHRYVSIHGWDITTSGLEKQTSAILEFYFWFRSWPFHRNRRVIVHRSAEFRPNWTTHCGNVTSYRFSRWRPSAMLCLLWKNGGPPTKCVFWSELGLQIAESLKQFYF